MNPVTIDIPIENVVKILAYYGEPVPTIFIYTIHLAAVGIRFLLNMNENNKNYTFDPISEGNNHISISFLYINILFMVLDNNVKKIMWTFDIRKNEMQQLEKLLLKLPKGKYAPLTKAEANSMIHKVQKKEEVSFFNLYTYTYILYIYI